MYGVVRRWTGDETRIEEATRKIQEEFLPALRRIEGFISYSFIQGHAGEVATVSLFDDRKGAEQSTRLAREFAERELEGIVQGPPQITEGEVALQELSREAGQASAPSR